MIKTILVYEVHENDSDETGIGEWPPQESGKFFDWFLQKITLLPEHYRDRARFKIFEEEGTAVIQMYYQREETTAEQRERYAEAHFKKITEAEKEYDNYLKLYKKYGIPK